MRYKEFYIPQEIELMVKALQSIEAIAETHNEKDKDWDIVYRLAHAGRSPNCRDSHPLWEIEIRDLHKSFQGEGLC